MRTIEESILFLEAWRGEAEDRRYELISPFGRDVFVYTATAIAKEGNEVVAMADDFSIQEVLHDLCEDLKP